ncbi:MAG: GNAT family N-acetyltransferase [Chitinophagales bacterium]|nr:GNAT family N-acetyltransferase [Chitinophagales bacterium]
MDEWIKHPVILQGQIIKLMPLEKPHFEELMNAASDKKLWEFTPTDASIPENFRALYNTALAERDKRNHYPFVILDNQTQRLIGSTRLFDIVPKDRKLEIGWTWITSNYWSSGVNFECKFLLLKYCFEVLKTIRVQLKTDETNLRSRKAIEKIGGCFEGILRKDRIKDNGIARNTAYYSIIDDEWNLVKEKIGKQLDDKLKLISSVR